MFANTTHFNLNIQGVETHDQLQVLSFDGIEAISGHYAFEITLVCKHLRFDITKLLSKPAYLSFTPSGLSGIHGVIHSVTRGAIGNQYAQFKVILAPRFSHLYKRFNQRKFVNKTVLDIITTILNEHGMQAEDKNGFVFKLKDKDIYKPREFCVQYDESDAHFIHRLCEESGIAQHYECTKDSHQLVFSDAQPFFPSLAQAIKYRSDTGFVADDPVFKRFDVNLKSATQTASWRDFNFKNVKIPEGSSKGSQSEKANGAIEPSLEHYDYPSSGMNIATNEQLAKIEIERLRANHVTAEAFSDVPSLHAGYFFTIDDYPPIDTLDASQPWLIKEIRHQGRQPQVLEEFGSEQAADNMAVASQLDDYFKHPIDKELVFPFQAFKQGYRNCLVATPREVPFRPQKLHPRATILGTQTAIVCGPAEEEIYCDEYGRVKVQFMWDREGNNDEHSSHWIRVANNWAGPHYGAITIPRIGMEVVVSFLESDPSQPFITGVIHNGKNKVPYELPSIKTQSTLKSKEYKGGGYNELLLDDTTGEVKTQIHSTPGTSQLNLGFLTHPRKSDGGGEHRGDGFELRTDEWGAIRAGKGIYLTADNRGSAASEQLDLKEAIEQLEYAYNLVKNLAEVSSLAKTREVDIADQHKQLEEIYRKLAKPSILASAPEGIAMVTPKSAQLSAQNNLTFTAGQHADITTQKDLRAVAGKAINLLAVEEEIKLAANKGSVEIQAQNNNMEIYADQNLKILSSKDRIEIAAQKEILLTSGKAYIKIADGNILIHAPGMVETKAATHPHAGPAAMDYNYQNYDPGKDEMFVVKDDTQTPLSNFRYKVLREDGKVFRGVTNAKGETQRIQTGPTALKFAIFEDDGSDTANHFMQTAQTSSQDSYVYETINTGYYIRQLAYLMVEGVGVGGTFFIKGTMVLDKNGKLFISALGDTAAKAAGTIIYDMYAEIRVNGKMVQKATFDNSEPGAWPNDGFAPIGTVKMQLPTAKPNAKITVFVSASYTFVTGHGIVKPMTSLNPFSNQATRATEEFEIKVISTTTRRT